jgi:hypothetical protein
VDNDRRLPCDPQAIALNETQCQGRAVRRSMAVLELSASQFWQIRKVGKPPHRSRSGRGRSMAGVGHEDHFPPPSLSDRCRLGEATFRGIGGKEEDAPIPAIRLTTIGRLDTSSHLVPARIVTVRAAIFGNTGKSRHEANAAAVRACSLKPGRLPNARPEAEKSLENPITALAEERKQDLALFNLTIDSKPARLRPCPPAQVDGSESSHYQVDRRL